MTGVEKERDENRIGRSDTILLNTKNIEKLKFMSYTLRAAIRNFHLGPCKIEKSKIAKLCHNKGLPKPFIKI